MTEIELIKKLQSDYPDKTSFNEAETRFKIVDEIRLLEKHFRTMVGEWSYLVLVCQKYIM